MTTAGDPGLDARDVAALQSAEAFLHDESARAGVEYVQTHISSVFLTGDRVYKFRKPVNLGFVDFTTRAQRTADCERELMLNRRLAPDVYLGLAALVHDGQRVRVGPIVQDATASDEFCVVMRRLSASRDALSMLEHGRLTRAHLERVAARVAEFHGAHRLGCPAPWSPEQWIARIQGPAEDNFTTLRQAHDAAIEESSVEAAASAARAFLDRSRESFERRRVDGRAVDGHGDLHLAHVWFEHDDGEPVIIDCLEFNDDLRRIDTAADVAFLAMDLVYRGARALAECFLAAYAELADDHDLYTVVDYYIAYRAAVRAKVAGLAAHDSQLGADQRDRAAKSARKHLELAAAAPAPKPAGMLVVMCGVVGTGKSSASRVFAEHLCAVRISSDAVRSHLHAGLSHEERYAAENRARIYRELVDRAAVVLRSGRTVVLDATFESRELRAAALRCAADVGSGAWLIEVTADPAAVRARLAARAARQSSTDASEAGPEQYAASVARFEPVDDWPASRRIRVQTDAPGWRGEVAGVAERLKKR